MKTAKETAIESEPGVLIQVEEQPVPATETSVGIKHAIAVTSGKGGVGTSAVAVNLAVALAQQGLEVGVVDFDHDGPSVAKMLGIEPQKFAAGDNGVLPVTGPLGIKVLTFDLCQSAAAPQNSATSENGVVSNGTPAPNLAVALANTDWGALDYLFIDVPSETDDLLQVARTIPALDGILVVTIPAEISHLIVKKSIALTRGVTAAPVIGLVENMQGYFCTHCGQTGELFPQGNGRVTARELGIPYLGGIPFDPRLADAGDRGAPYLVTYRDTATGQAILKIAKSVTQFFADKNHKS